MHSVNCSTVHRRGICQTATRTLLSREWAVKECCLDPKGACSCCHDLPFHPHSSIEARSYLGSLLATAGLALAHRKANSSDVCTAEIGAKATQRRQDVPGVPAQRYLLFSGLVRRAGWRRRRLGAVAGGELPRLVGHPLY